MSTTTQQVIGEAVYKNRKYAVLYIGEFNLDGQQRKRVKLAFTDLSKEFWVDRSAITLERFPQPVDAADYQATDTKPNGQSVHLEKTTDQTEDELPSYCQHCGQRIPIYNQEPPY